MYIWNNLAKITLGYEYVYPKLKDKSVSHSSLMATNNCFIFRLTSITVLFLSTLEQLCVVDLFPYILCCFPWTMQSCYGHFFMWCVYCIFFSKVASVVFIFSCIIFKTKISIFVVPLRNWLATNYPASYHPAPCRATMEVKHNGGKIHLSAVRFSYINRRKKGKKKRKQPNRN